jgi:hypothetical protein
MSNIIWYNIPELKGNKEFYRNPYYKSLRSLMQGKNPKPCFLYFNNSKIEFLENLKHSDTAIKSLNSTGLNIFLYEPLCYKEEGSRFNFGFYSEFKSSNTLKKYVSEELESIKKYVLNNNLINVCVYTGDYRIEEFFSNYSNFLKLRCDDIFLKHRVVFEPYKFTENFDKKFFSPNWRYTTHRQLIVAYLANLESSLLSWHFFQDFNNFEKHCFFKINEWENVYIKLKKGFDIVNKNTPYYFDHKKFKIVVKGDGSDSNNDLYKVTNPVSINDKNKIITDCYNRSFCVIVTETRFAQPTGNFSEKLLDAVRHKKPFILVAPAKTLEYFRSLGYKTFGQFWDESYDYEEDPEKRILKIFNLIDEIESTSIEELKNLHKQMTDVLEHNFNNFISNSAVGTLQKL